MKFFGIKKVVTIGQNYEQIAELEAFWNEMRSKFKNVLLMGLGTNWTKNTMDYYIGKIDTEWRNGLSIIDLPDNGWNEFECKLDNQEIEKMYRNIYRQGTPDYEIESMTTDMFKAKVHFANNGEKDEI